MRWPAVTAVVAVLLVAAVAAGLGVAGVAADGPDRGDEIADVGPGNHTIDVSAHDWVVAEIDGASGESGGAGQCPRGDSVPGGSGGAGAHVSAAINVSGIDTLNATAAEWGETSGWNDGEVGELRLGDDELGSGGEGAGSTAIGWSDTAVLEAGGGGGGGGGSCSGDTAGDGGVGGGELDNGGVGGAGGEAGNPGEAGGPGAGYWTGGQVRFVDEEVGGAETDDGSITIYEVGGQYDPDLSSPNPPSGGVVSDRSVNLSVHVDDPDFDEQWSDEVTVEFFDAADGSSIGNDTVSATGRASVTYSADPGENSWEVVATDSGGNTASLGPITFKTPSSVEFRDVHNNTLIDDREVSVEFVTDADDVVEQRTTTDGSVDLGGLSADAYLAEISADGYHSRTFLVDSVFEQQRAYLLADSADTSAVEHRFQLEDNTGQFRPSDTTLVLQRVVDFGGESRFVSVAGDGFGAANEVIVTLEQDVRYRLRLRNGEGMTRHLGDWRAVGTGPTRLEVGRVSWSAESETWRWRTDFENTTVPGENRTAHIEFEYEDPSNATTQLDLRVYEHRNEENVVHEETYTGEIGVVSETVDLTGDDVERTWRVEWEATRDGETIGASRTVADDLSVTDNPFVGQWQLVVVAFVLVFIAFLFGGVFSGIGAVFVACVAAFLWWLGWFAIGGAVILGAILVGVLWMLGGIRPGGGI